MKPINHAVFYARRRTQLAAGANRLDDAAQEMRLRLLATLFTQLTVLGAVLAGLGGCAEPLEWECRQTADCPAGELCRVSRCVPADELSKKNQPSSTDNQASADGQSSGQMTDTDVWESADGQGSDADLDSSADPPRCPDSQPPMPGDLVINEVLANPPTGPAGDANGDGVRDAFEDEFVELVNISGHLLDLTDARIRVDGRDKFSFPITCLEDRGAAVIFGGGNPNPSRDYLVFVSDTRLSLSNTGGTISLIAPDGEILRNMSYENAKPVSITLSPELYGTQYIAHTELNSDALFSPGTCADGRLFQQGCADDMPEDEPDHDIDEEAPDASSGDGDGDGLDNN